MRSTRNVPSVVTGQQAGLFGGPLFTLAKLLGAVKLARARGERAVFWIECDDADIAEVDQARVVGAAGELVRFSLGEPADGRPVAARTLGPGIEALLLELETSLPRGEAAAAALADLRACWVPGAHWHEAFGRYLARLTEGLEVTFLDPSSLEHKQAASPIVARVLASPDAVEAALEAGSRLVERPQVPHLPGEMPVFVLDDTGIRRKLERRGTGYGLKGSSLTLSRDEARLLLEREPARFSPGVLLRPVVQDFVLPTTLYVAGPSEAAYHAQLGPLYELLEVTRPGLVPRPRLTLVDARARRLLEKLSLPLAVALEGESAIEKRLAVAASGLDPVARAAATSAEVGRELERLRLELEPLDPGTLGPLFAEVGAKVGFQIGKLGGRALESMKRRSGETALQARKLAALLCPGGEPQERVLCPASFLGRVRREALVEAVLAAIDPADPGRQLELELGGAAA